MNSPAEKHMNIGALVFPQMDQIDLTGHLKCSRGFPILNST